MERHQSQVCWRNDFECTKLLIENKAPIDADPWRHDTPLHRACRNMSVDCVKLLLEHNIETKIIDVRGKKAVDLLFDRIDDMIPNPEIIRMIKRAENRQRQYQRICVLVGWYRANYFHEYRHSVLPLVGEIMKYL